VAPAVVDHPVARRWWVMVLSAAAGALLTIGVTLAIPAPYVDSVTLVVDLPDSATDAETIIRTVQGLTTSGAVLGGLASASKSGLSESEIASRLRVERQIGAGVINISVSDRSARRARAIGDQLAPVLEERLQGNRDVTDPSATLLGAHSFTEPTLERPRRRLLPNAVLGATVGFNVGLIGTAIWVRRRRTQA
jgi:capsular polysaccharide biosynthesis protein